jgi:hypothetical protein
LDKIRGKYQINTKCNMPGDEVETGWQQRNLEEGKKK